MSTLLLAPALPGFEALPHRFAADVDLKRPRPMGYGLWLAISPPPELAQHIACRAAAHHAAGHRAHRMDRRPRRAGAEPCRRDPSSMDSPMAAALNPRPPAAQTGG